MKLMIVALCLIAVASAMPTGEPPKPPKPIMNLIRFCMKMVEKVEAEQEEKRDFEAVFEQLFPQCLALANAVRDEMEQSKDERQMGSGSGRRPDGSGSGMRPDGSGSGSGMRPDGSESGSRMRPDVSGSGSGMRPEGSGYTREPFYKRRMGGKRPKGSSGDDDKPKGSRGSDDKPKGSRSGDDKSRPTGEPPMDKGDGRKGSHGGDDKSRPTGQPPMSKGDRPTGEPTFEKRRGPPKKTGEDKEITIDDAAKEFLGICKGLAEMAEKMMDERSLSDDEFMAIMMGVQSACDAAKTEAEAMKAE